MFRLRNLSVLVPLITCSAEMGLADPDRKTILYSFMSNVGPLNPHMYSSNQMFNRTMVYDPLAKLSADGSISLALAENRDISDDDWACR